MHVCIAIEGAFQATYGGGQVYVRRLAYALRDTGHRITVFEIVHAVDDEAFPQTRQHDGLWIIRRHVPHGDSPKLQVALQEGLLTVAPDVVHANGLKLPIAQACNKLRVPCVITAHHGGIVCPAGSLLDYNDRICGRALEQVVCTQCAVQQQPFGPLWAASLRCLPRRFQIAIGRMLRKIPFIPFATPALCTPLQVHNKILEVRELTQKAVFLVAPSKAMHAALLRNGADPKRTAVVPHGVPLREHPSRLTGTTTYKVRFLYIGRLNRVKGVHVLIEAFNNIGLPSELHIAGKAANKSEARYWNSVVKRIADANRVIEHGYLTEDALRDLLIASDVVVVPSIFLEVFGLVVAEALAAGKPVITTDCGGPTEQILNERNGLVVEPNNVKALALAMQRFVDDPSLAPRLARNTRPPTSIDQHVQAIIDLYTKCINHLKAAYNSSSSQT